MPPKRKQTPLDDEDSLSEEVEDVSEDFIRVKRPRTESVETVVQDSWIDKYSPLNSLEICVNPRKLKELREVLEPMIRGTLECRLLVVTGPAGCGKSTLIKCLGNELVAKVKEASLGKTEPNKSQEGGFPNIVEYFDSELQDVSHIRHFSEFLDASRYRIGSNLALIVVEEYPNVFHHETLQSFRDCIRNWLYSPGTLPPLVLCLTEIEIESESGHRGYYNIENNFTAETLLGRALMTHGVSSGVVQRVKFLPIAKTFMKKSISKVIQKERVKIPPEKQVLFLSSLYESGDIRALLSNLQLWARTGSFDSDLSGKENQISLFHAVGKVVHSSAKFASMDEESSDSFSIRAVLDGYNNFGLLHLALLENYQIYSGLQYEVAVAADLVDALSISDTLGGLEESHEYAIREVRHQLRNVGESRGRTQPMKFPRHFKMLKAANKVKREVDNYSRYIGDSRVSFANVNLLDGYFVPSIFNSFRYKLQNGSKPYSYNRVGGKFQQIFADDEVPVMESEFEHELGVKDQFAMEIEAKMGGSEDRNDGLSEDDLSDEIHNTTDDDNDNDDFNDSLDDKLVSLTQRHDEDELSDDPELDWLVSQGRL
ncbi:CIC11C00000002176 [Sungouiella intermedia]|uniref:CIC11C00000002176 n=1 Tax=Sungouiella intermedia TaxID=45354 RepID=A0A1L0E2B5_9ASCO|nr:CIC11C00000002176 [[Candida] intermedia]